MHSQDEIALGHGCFTIHPIGRIDGFLWGWASRGLAGWRLGLPRVRGSDAGI